MKQTKQTQDKKALLDDETKDLEDKILICEGCKRELKDDERFKLILIHNADKNDVKMGAFSNLEDELILCDKCYQNYKAYIMNKHHLMRG